MTKSISNQRLNWIMFVKGFACIIVYLQHYNLSFGNLGNDYFFSKKIFYFLTNGNFAVCIFFSVSSYLVCLKIWNETTMNNIASISLKRFLRLIMPIFCSSVFSFVLYKTCGFHNLEIAEIYDNLWLSRYYTTPLSLKKLISSVLYGVLWNGDWEFNAPFWMLSAMFKSTYIAIILAVIVKSLKTRIFQYVMLISLLGVYYHLQDNLFMSTIFGILWFCVSIEIKEKISVSFKGYYTIFLVPIVIALVLQGEIETMVASIRDVLHFEGYILNVRCWNSVFAYVILQFLDLWLGGSDFKILSTITYLGNISMGIYLFHFPIICSIGAILYLNSSLMMHSWGLLIHFLIITGIVVAMAIIYTSYIEKLWGKMINKFILYLF